MRDSQPIGKREGARGNPLLPPVFPSNARMQRLAVAGGTGFAPDWRAAWREMQEKRKEQSERKSQSKTPSKARPLVGHLLEGMERRMGIGARGVRAADGRRRGAGRRRARGKRAAERRGAAAAQPQERTV